MATSVYSMITYLTSVYILDVYATSERDAALQIANMPHEEIAAGENLVKTSMVAAKSLSSDEVLGDEWDKDFLVALALHLDKSLDENERPYVENMFEDMCNGKWDAEASKTLHILYPERFV